MIVERRSSVRLGLLALALVLPIAACETKEAPPVVIPATTGPAPVPQAMGPDGKPIGEAPVKP